MTESRVRPYRTWHLLQQRLSLCTGDRHGGVTKVLYDPSYSEKGVLMAAARKPRAASELDFEVPRPAGVSDRSCLPINHLCVRSVQHLVAQHVGRGCAGANHHQEPACAANVPRGGAAHWRRPQAQGALL